MLFVLCLSVPVFFLFVLVCIVEARLCHLVRAATAHRADRLTRTEANFSGVNLHRRKRSKLRDLIGDENESPEARRLAERTLWWDNASVVLFAVLVALVLLAVLVD